MSTRPPFKKVPLLKTLIGGPAMATKETEIPLRHDEDGLPLSPICYGMRAAKEAANALFEKSGEEMAPDRLAEGRPP